MYAGDSTSHNLLIITGLIRKVHMGQNDNEYLFSGDSWSGVARDAEDHMVAKINQMDGNRLLNTSPDDLTSYFAETYRYDVPILDEKGVVLSHREQEIE